MDMNICRLSYWVKLRVNIYLRGVLDMLGMHV